MGTGVRLFLAEPGSNRRVGGFDGKRLGIEVAADPLEPFGVFGMSGVGQDGKQLLIAPWPAAILRRAVPLSGDAGGVSGVGERRLGLLDQDRMFPVIAEVIGIGEAGDA